MVEYTRQLLIFDPEQFANKYITIVGLGNIGSHAALTLARLGLKHFMLFDPDTIEPHNLSSQAYGESDIGKSKVLAVADKIKELNPAAEVVIHDQAFTGKEEFFNDVLIFGVDSMDVRKQICNVLNDKLTPREMPKLLIDGRIGGNQLELYMPKSWLEWWQSLPNNAAEEPCGGRYISYVSVVIGGLIANQVKKFLRGEPLDSSIMMDVNSLQIIKNFRW